MSSPGQAVFAPSVVGATGARRSRPGWSLAHQRRHRNSRTPHL